ncbi:hypothetical protein AAFF_G00262490 [Aldrovandia affinis]|uniref:Uncharacterized protein n=1 Tax=Aldrovandia affinis TaxID=143900 RepID=A0AAD7SUF5_9TELE|nr:hypothetical protein AAFF_G00262490 [Aldrovandia affinis]
MKRMICFASFRCHQAEMYTMGLKSATILGIMTALYFCECSMNNNNKHSKVENTGDNRGQAGYCNESELISFPLLKSCPLLIVDENYTGVIQLMNTDCSLHSQQLQSDDDNGTCNKTKCSCILSYHIKNGTKKGDSGLYIQKEDQSYNIYLWKEYVEYFDDNALCFLPCSCNTSEREQQRRGRHVTGESQDSPCGVMGAMDVKSCKGMIKYDQTLCEDSNMDEDSKVISFKTNKPCEYSPKCVTCNNPLKEPNIHIDLNDIVIDVSESGEVNAASAVKAMKGLSSVLDDLKNESIARITIGPMKGILKRQESKYEFEEAFFGLSPGLNVNNIEDVTTLEEGFPGLVSIPKEAFAKANLSSGNKPFVAVFLCQNMTKDVKNSRLLNSEVIVIEMGANITNLTDRIKLAFKKGQGDTRMSCSSWNGEGDRPVWMTDGCNTTEDNETVTCQCTHLTFFAILMTSPGTTISSSDLKSLTYITYVGCGMSMFFLGIALFMHFLLRKAKANQATQILMNLFMAMFLLNLSFLCNEAVADLENLIACKIMAAVMHYSMLSTFTWFAIEAFHLCFQLIKSFNITIKRYILKVCIAGWALPSVVIIILFCLGKYGSLTINSDNEKSAKLCWIIDITTHYVVNIGYYVLVFLFTFTVFIVIARQLTYIRRLEKGASQKGTGPMNIFSILGLCCLLGIGWGFAFFSYGPLRLPSYYIFTIINSFQGFFLFLYYYNTNKIIGEETASSSSVQSTSTLKSTVDCHNPYLG